MKLIEVEFTTLWNHFYGAIIVCFAVAHILCLCAVFQVLLLPNKSNVIRYQAINIILVTPYVRLMEYCRAEQWWCSFGLCHCPVLIWSSGVYYSVYHNAIRSFNESYRMHQMFLVSSLE